MLLIENGTATGDWAQWSGGRGLFDAEGTFGGATIQLQWRGPNGTAIDVTGAALEANGGTLFELPPVQIRAAVTGGPPSGIYARALQF